VKPWVLLDAARRFENTVDDEQETEFINSSRGYEGHDERRERRRRLFMKKAINNMRHLRHRTREQRQQERQEDNVEAKRKRERKSRARTQLLELADRLSCSTRLREKARELKLLGRKWINMTLQERKDYHKRLHPTLQCKKKCKKQRAKERGCDSCITKRCEATYKEGVHELHASLKKWIDRKDKEGREETKLRTRIKKWFSMTAQEKEVYSRKKLLLAKQKNKAKVRRSVMKGFS
jgi:hypothetical protein